MDSSPLVIALLIFVAQALDLTKAQYPFTFLRRSRDNQIHSPGYPNGWRKINRIPRPQQQQRLADWSKFSLKSDLQWRDAYATCMAEADANIAYLRREGVRLSAGSGGYSFSRGTERGKELLCRAKAYETQKGKYGRVKRIGVESKAVLSTAEDVDSLLNPKASKMDELEIGTKGQSALSEVSKEKKTASVVETKDGGAGSTSLTKTRLTDSGLESKAAVRGGTETEKRGVGLKSKGRDVTHLLRNPNKQWIARQRDAIKGEGEVLSFMSHSKGTDFEIEF